MATIEQLTSIVRDITEATTVNEKIDLLVKVGAARLDLPESERPTAAFPPDNPDPWVHRADNMMCRTCMWFVLKQGDRKDLGRCRRRCPTMNGYPVVFITDWCGEHKLDETKAAG